MLPTGVVELYGGPDDGTRIDLHPELLPRTLTTERGLYVRDPSVDIVRATGLPLHRFRWCSRPPEQLAP
jgi:hypothetical protein